MHSQKEREKYSPSCSLNEVGSPVGARKQIDFFLLRKQPHNDGTVCSCEACELARGDRIPVQPLRSPGELPRPNGGKHMLTPLPLERKLHSAALVIG